MRLSDREFRAMNSGVRRIIQRTVEFPLFRKMGLTDEHSDILEIGCGSGYGAVLLANLSPKSYIGLDIMPEQIALARRRPLNNAGFMLCDATDLGCFPDESKDIVIDFGILHHIPEWRTVIEECHRVLRKGGKLFVEEPDGALVVRIENLFPWGHPPDACFRLRDLEDNLNTNGFDVLKRQWVLGFGFYCARKKQDSVIDHVREYLGPQARRHENGSFK